MRYLPTWGGGICRAHITFVKVRHSDIISIVIEKTTPSTSAETTPREGEVPRKHPTGKKDRTHMRKKPPTSPRVAETEPSLATPTATRSGGIRRRRENNYEGERRHSDVWRRERTHRQNPPDKRDKIAYEQPGDDKAGMWLIRRIGRSPQQQDTRASSNKGQSRHTWKSPMVNSGRLGRSAWQSSGLPPRQTSRR